MNKFHISRRTMMASGLAMGLVSPPAFAQEGEIDDVASLFLDNAEPRPDTLIGSRALTDWPLWWKQDPRPVAAWEAEAASVDLGHLPVAKSDAVVSLDAALFRRALAACFIDETKLGARVLFGLRGARLANPADFSSGGVFKSVVSLVEDTPDHFTPHCILGVWDRGSGGFWATQASTVCNVAYLYGQALAKQRDTFCNMLPAGVYQYKVGTHRNKSDSRQPGAFILDSSVAIVRNFNADRLAFTSASHWEYRGADVADNIHAAYYAAEGMPAFSSAGCQTIPGTVRDSTTRSKHVGPWREFRIAAGLKADPTIIVDAANRKNVSTTEDWNSSSVEAVRTRFSYVLMPAREVIMLHGRKPAQDSELLKLRRGSQGDVVRKLQKALGLGEDGDFGFRTQQAVINRQLLAGWADGVLTRDRLADLALPDVFA